MQKNVQTKVNVETKNWILRFCNIAFLEVLKETTANELILHFILLMSGFP